MRPARSAAEPTPFERRKTLGMYWYNKACDLRGAAGLVWAGIKDEDPARTAQQLGLGKGFSFAAACWPVYQMLCGLALELLLKAAVVTGGEAPKATHDLGYLWSRLNLPLTEADSGVLALLSESIKWAGRYPVPKEEADFKRLRDLSDRHLMDKFPLGNSGLEIRRYNGRLDWSAFGELWGTAHAHAGIHRLFSEDPVEP